MSGNGFRLPRRVGVAVTVVALALILVEVLAAFGANAGQLLGYSAAFVVWLGLMALGWRWFTHLDRSDDEGADGA